MDFRSDSPHVFPTNETLQALLNSESDSPIVMVNLLKLKKGGEAARDKYIAGVTPLLEAVGGSFVYVGPVAGNVIGNADWDVIALVRYPRPKAFAEMVLSDAYAAVAPYRAQALERAELIMTNAT